MHLKKLDMDPVNHFLHLSQSLSGKCQDTKICKELVDISFEHVSYTEIPLLKSTRFITLVI